MAKKRKKAKATRTTSVIKDCAAVKQIKDLSVQIGYVELPAGTPAYIKTRLSKLAGRVYTGAENIGKALQYSIKRIESAKKKKARLEKRIADAKSQLKELA